MIQLCLALVLPLAAVVVVHAGGAPTPIRSLTVTLRGQPYEIEDVTTVGELRAQLAQQTGSTSPSESSQQQRLKLLLAGGQRLPDDPDAVLADAGVPTQGAHLSAVPSSSKSSGSGKKKKPPSTAAAAASSTASAAAATAASKPTAAASTAGAAAASNPMADYLKQSGVDTAQLDEMMKGVTGGSGGGGEAQPSMQDSVSAMMEAMKSPLFQEMMNDPERLEQSRQMILSNPMLKSMMSGMPGMEELINDPDAWREAMQAVAELYQNMDSDELIQAMSGSMGGAAAGGMGGLGGGAGGMGGGAGSNLFDGTLDDSASTAALDELDEDE